MLFLDGVGIGRNDPGVNPFLVAQLPAFRSLSGGGIPTLRSRRFHSGDSAVIPLDATLGIRGLPQSGTGQTSLFVGVNGPRLAGKHFGPFPYSTLRPIIREKNIFRRLLEAGKRPCFANAFPQRYFDYMDRHPSRLTVTSLSCVSSGVPRFGSEELRAGRAISADITNDAWPMLGYPDMPRIEPSEAGQRVLRLIDRHDFVLFEYWRTDKAGHAHSLDDAVRVLEIFDAMLAAIVDGLDVRTTLLVMTSDHGNLEDLSTKTHTRNPVPLYLFGHRHAEFAALIQGRSKRPPSLRSISPTILRLLADES